MNDHSRLKAYLEKVTDDVANDSNCNSRIASDILLSLKFTDGHMHHHLPDKEITRSMVEDLLSASDIDLTPEKKEITTNKDPIIFRNRQAIGDILMMTVAIRDFHNAFPDWPINVQSTASHIWDNNPYLDRSLNNSNAKVIEIGPSFLTNASNRDDRHFANAFRISIQDKLGIEFPQGPIKPDIWMTQEEIKTPIIEPPYWIIVAGEKGDWTAKTYPFYRWQKIINAFPEMKFVQVGAKEHKHPKLTGDNVIDYIGKTQDRDTGIRDIFRLYYFAEGSMGLVSFQMHLAAAFNMPCVTIAGAREPARFTLYPGHQYLATDGCLPCAETKACWHCDLEKTCPVIIERNGSRFPQCVDIIKSKDVIRAIQQYYEGGRLSFDHPRIPTFPNSVSRKIEIPISMKRDRNLPEANFEMTTPPSSDVDPNEYGFKWGGACITDQDWSFLYGVIKKYNIKSVLEFGPGLSSFLMAKEGLHVVSFETSPGWIKSLKEKGSDELFDLNVWDGKILNHELPKFDLAIVDGPPGGSTREESTRIASEHADIVLVHDAGRSHERMWQDKYLKENFDGPGKGGHRFHLWVKKNSKLEIKEPEVIVPLLIEGQKIFRIFCNTRGDGGCGRSIHYFMKAFVSLGWRVEYVYSNAQPSGTHRRCGSGKVIATNNLDVLRDPCDVFMLATDDFVWEFSKPEVVEMFSNINAKRKIMYVNFKIGKIGEVPWTQNFDKYLFLNKSLSNAFTLAYMKAKGNDQVYSLSPFVLPPPADISEHLETEPDYSGPMRIVRHSSQGNSKYANDFNEKIEAILFNFPEATIRLMPPPSFINNFGERVITHQRNVPEVNEFLKMGNIYWYDLPEQYTEGGPRVLVEALAAGLPCIASNNPGAQDRITEDTGFLYNDFEESLSMFEKLNDPIIREKMGRAAKEHARIKFNPDIWMKHIIGEN